MLWLDLKFSRLESWSRDPFLQVLVSVLVLNLGVLVLVLDKQVLNPSLVMTKHYLPEWMRMWFLWLVALAKVLPQPGMSHEYGRSPVCVLIWTLRMLDVVNARSQPAYGQRNGFSPNNTWIHAVENNLVVVVCGVAWLNKYKQSSPLQYQLQDKASLIYIVKWHPFFLSIS